MSNLIVFLTEDGIPCLSVKMSANNELLVKAALGMMKESGCRKAYIMEHVGPEVSCETAMYKSKACVVYEGQLNVKPPKADELEVDFETFKMMP